MLFRSRDPIASARRDVLNKISETELNQLDFVIVNYVTEVYERALQTRNAEFEEFERNFTA